MLKDLQVGTRVDHSLYGEGLISKINITNYEIFFHKAGKITISKDSDEIDIIEDVGDTTNKDNGFNLSEIEELLTHVLDKYEVLPTNVDLGEKWIGGKMILVPGKKELQSKEIPIETFFHKIVMMREKLRVLEQNINTNNNLSEEEKINLQQYITRIYGSMTSFNVLFSDKNDYFTSKS